MQYACSLRIETLPKNKYEVHIYFLCVFSEIQYRKNEIC